MKKISFLLFIIKEKQNYFHVLCFWDTNILLTIKKNQFFCLYFIFLYFINYNFFFMFYVYEIQMFYLTIMENQKILLILSVCLKYEYLIDYKRKSIFFRH